jgi:hypothetical protein
MNYTSNSLPQAYVSVGKNKSRLKIYNGKTVFVKDGEEFQLVLFNPTQKTIGAKIFINGNSISNSMLVLKPGERSYLERYLDDNKKFLFETYNVENSKEVKEAIKQNGIVKVEFYNEKVVSSFPIYGTTNTFTYPGYYNPTFTITPNYFGGTTTGGYVTNTGTTISTGLSGLSGDVGMSGPSGSSGTSTCASGISNNLFYCSSNIGAVPTGTVTTTSSGTTFISPGISTRENDSSATMDSMQIETGRIEKGDVSNQSFGNYYGDFESYYFLATDYILLPESQKPVEVKDIRQYCPGCRTRVKKASWKFCPSCGESLD